MNYKTYQLENFHVHFIKTKKFKTVEVRCFFQNKADKKEITYRNCLTDVLTFASFNYPSKRELTLKSYELYSLYLTSNNTRIGNNIVTKLGISMLNPKYVKEVSLKDSLDFLKEIIYHPLVKNNKFDDEIVDFIKRELEAETSTIKEQSKLYSNIRLLEETGKDDPYVLNGYSDLDILKEINGTTLYAFYKHFLEDSMVDIFVIGDVLEKEYLDYFQENFAFGRKKRDDQIIYYHQNYRKRVRKVQENSNFSQSKLAISFKMMDLNEFEYRYVINLYNSILGGGNNNLLIKYVREKEGLAYYINTILCKTDNLIILNSGIESENYEKVVDLIKKVMKDISLGKFDEKDLLSSQNEYITAYDEIVEDISGMADIALGKVLFHSDDLETRKKKIMEVTKDDVINISRKIKMDTIYFLKGGYDD